MSSRACTLQVLFTDTETRGPAAPAWAAYAEEVLAHFGLPRDTAGGDRPAVVLLAGDSSTELDFTALLDQVAKGTVLVACGGAEALAAALGMSVGPVRPHDLVRFGDEPETLSSFGGLALVTAHNHDVLATYADGAVAVAATTWGAGRVELWGVDLWQSIVRIQQGWPIDRPGAPAPDGSVPKRDTILRADDSLALAYERRSLQAKFEPQDTYDHTYPPARPSPIFARAEADLWRARLLASLIAAHRAAQSAFAWLDYWPDGLPAIAHMSHDSDRNIDSQARVAIAAFANAGVAVTWCHCHPGGYSPEVVAEIGAAGHEHAFHYNAVDDTEADRWGLAYATHQLAWAREMTGAAISTNKNHYTRWEGWTEFYEWCDELGILVDQSRGPSKQGTVGFPFGSAHLWRPLLPTPGRSTLAKVLQLPLHSQDLVFFAHESVREPILDGVLEVHGVAHFLFHGSNMEDHPEVVPAVTRTAEAARGRGLEWWTAEQIGAWEQSRRGVRLKLTDGGISVTTPKPVRGLGLLLPADNNIAPELIDQAGRWLEIVPVIRHGIPHWLVRCDLPAGTTNFQVGARSRA